MAEPEADRADAAAFIRDAPFEVHMALLRRLSPKWILRMRKVCRAWRDMLSHGALLYPLHRLAPPQPLIYFERTVCRDGYLRLKDYCVESLDLRSGKLCYVLRITDTKFYEFEEDDQRRVDPPPIHDFRVDYDKMKKEKYVEEDVEQLLMVHGSLDGYLLIAFTLRWYVVNPAMRHWVSVPSLADLDVIGFYQHATSGEYRVLCFSDGDHGHPPTYCVLTVISRAMRFIGFPISPAAPEDHGLRMGVVAAYGSPPIQLRRNLHLHWPPQKRQGYHILVFDTDREEFSWKNPPPVMDIMDQDMRLLEFPNGNLGLSVSTSNEATLELWCLEGYQNEVWVRTYKIRLPVQQMPDLLQGEDSWIPFVVSPEGDVLIKSKHWLLHYDGNGKMRHLFWFPERVMVRQHVLRESLLQNQMFWAPNPDGIDAPPFVNWLCNDPSW